MEKIIYQGKIIEVVEKEISRNGKNQTFESARRSPGVRLIILKDDKILLSKEFRYELNGYDLRLPGGKVYDLLNEYNEAIRNNVDINKIAEKAAIKEASEETGIVVEDISFFHKSVCGATINWDLFYFIVNNFKDGSQNLEEGEDITFDYFTIKDVKEMCLNGLIQEERSALVLLRYINSLY